MKWFLILCTSALIALVIAHFVPASNGVATHIGGEPIKWFMIGGFGFAVFCLFASKKLK